MNRRYTFSILFATALLFTPNQASAQSDIEFIFGKWSLIRKTVDGEKKFELSENASDDMARKYIRFKRGTLNNKNGGLAISNLATDGAQPDSIAFSYSDNYFTGLKMKLVVIDADTIELQHMERRGSFYERETSYLLVKDKNTDAGPYMAYSPGTAIILQQSNDNLYASRFGYSGMELRLKKKPFTIVFNSITFKTSQYDYGYHIVFSEGLDAKNAFEAQLNQENTPYLSGNNHFECTPVGYTNLNISKATKTHFLFYENKANHCGVAELSGAFMGSTLKWDVHSFALDGNYAVKRDQGKLKSLPFDTLYMHVFFDSNQNGVIETEEYSCTTLQFK